MLIFKDMTFDQMAMRFGETSAYSLLEEIERAAGLYPEAMMGECPEMRLSNAYRLQDNKRKPVAAYAATELLLVA